MAIDIAIIAAYLLLINVIGICSSRAKNMNDYFLGGNKIAWPVACFSIVATETSTLTFISIPGLAYVKGTGFIQIALGYLVGRVLVAVFLIPEYYRGRLHTVYEYLQLRFGQTPRLVVSVLFHITRLLADSIRLFATAIPLAMLMGWGDYRLAVLVMGAATLVYTLYGGIRSVMIIDSIQLFLYVVCAFIGLFVVAHLMNLSLPDVFYEIPAERLNFLSTGFEGEGPGLFGGYNIISGLLGGALLSVASHGTDHLIVQRVLSCRDEAGARKAVVVSGVVVFFQFALFLLLGLFIMVLLQSRPFEKPDEIMPYFIVHSIPRGLRGVMLAGMFAAAMSSLSSTINSLSASTAMDILRINEKVNSGRKQLRISRVISLLWTALIMLIAMSFHDNTSPLVELGLSISSLIYGGVLAIFIQARFFPGFSDRAALVGVFVGIAGTIVIAQCFTLFWPWYIPVGLCISLAVSALVNYLLSGKKD